MVDRRDIIKGFIGLGAIAALSLPKLAIAAPKTRKWIQYDPAAIDLSIKYDLNQAYGQTDKFYFSLAYQRRIIEQRLFRQGLPINVIIRERDPFFPNQIERYRSALYIASRAEYHKLDGTIEIIKNRWPDEEYQPQELA